jgi:anti-anti-sigma regulatory factor
MRGDQQSRSVAHLVFAPSLVDGTVVEELDTAVEHGARELVVDLSATRKIDDEALLLLDWLARRLENAGGSLAVTARRAPRGAHVTRTLRGGDLTHVLGVHAALDRAVLHRLARAGGAALW